MPLHRRLPKRGFKNPFRQEYEVVNLRDLGRVEGDVVNVDVLAEVGLIRSADSAVKILGEGELDRALDVTATAFSKSAAEKIEKAGGKVTVQ
jgi:large subunit ribosomal protein L15